MLHTPTVSLVIVISAVVALASSRDDPVQIQKCVVSAISIRSKMFVPGSFEPGYDTDDDPDYPEPDQPDISQWLGK